MDDTNWLAVSLTLLGWLLLCWAWGWRQEIKHNVVYWTRCRWRGHRPVEGDGFRCLCGVCDQQYYIGVGIDTYRYWRPTVQHEAESEPNEPLFSVKDYRMAQETLYRDFVSKWPSVTLGMQQLAIQAEIMYEGFHELDRSFPIPPWRRANDPLDAWHSEQWYNPGTSGFLGGWYADDWWSSQ